MNLPVPTRAKDLVKEEIYKALDTALHEVGVVAVATEVFPLEPKWDPPFSHFICNFGA